jgi:uncharacterized protein YjdB
VTGASDQYALGCVAFELIAGRPPFVHQEVVPVLLAHVSDVPPPLLQFRSDCPIELAAVIDKMLAKDPAERWATLGEAIETAEAAPHAASATIRAVMRALSGVDAAEAARPIQNVPVSPLPSPRTAVSGPRAATASTAVAAEVLTVAIQPNGAVLQAGSGLQLHATARDRAGLAVAEATVEWRSSAPDVVAVSSAGVVTARTEGEAEISAVSGPALATVRVRVARVPVGRVRLTASSGAWQVGERRLLSAVVVDQAGSVLPGRPIQWSTLDPDVAIVAPDGVVHARGPGQARIRATAEGQTAETVLEVEGASGELGITPGEGALAVGQVVRLRATFRDARGRVKPAVGAAWSSSDPTVLRVTPDGELTAFRPGAARIKASCSGKVLEIGYQVTRVDVAQVRIGPRLASLGAGEEVRLEAEATDRLGTILKGRIVTWASSHPDVAAVGPDGVLRGVTPGMVRISATIGAGMAWMELRVTPVSISAVKLDPAGVVLNVGDTAGVRAVLQTLRGGTVEGLPVEWQSSDPAIATVNADGVVMGMRFGVARIAASAGGRRATIPVEVRAASSVSSPRVSLGST